MSALAIRILFLVVFLLSLALETLLGLLNVAFIRRNAGTVPDAFRDMVDSETAARSAQYTVVRARFGLIAQIASAGFFLIVMLSGLFGVVDDAVRTLPIHRYLQGIVFIAATALVFRVLALPFSLYSTFSIESRFGFNKTTVGLYFVDALKGLAITAVIGIPVLLGLFWFMDSTGRWWWVWAFCAISVVQLVLSVIAPLVIMPLFNKFTPLPDGELRERILDLARRLDFKTSGIYVVDSSKRSRHSNAYFTGLGRTKRVVLFDTLVESSSVDEILAVLAHEIGHEKHRHVVQGIALSILLSLAGFWIMSVLLPYAPLYRAFGFHTGGYQEIVVLLLYGAPAFISFLQPLFSIWSRRHEYQADRFAVRSVGSAAPLRAALLRLSKDNLSNLTPHPLYSMVFYSHPPLAERIAALERAEADLDRTG